MSQNSQSPVEKRIVSNETIPARLFACFAEVDPSAGAALAKSYATGENLPNALSVLHRKHLLHNHRDIAQAKVYWQDHRRRSSDE